MAHNKALQTDVRDDERAGRRMGMDGAAGARRVADAHDAYEFVLQFHPIHVRHGEQRIRTRRARLRACEREVFENAHGGIRSGFGAVLPLD